MIDTGLQGKVVLVTGANHGIGAATAQAFAAEGAAVFITYLRAAVRPIEAATTSTEAYYRSQQAKSADEVLHVIHSRGGQAAAWECDLANPQTLPELFNRVEQAFGSVDVLVNNAAYCVADTFLPAAQEHDDLRAPSGFAITSITSHTHDAHFIVNSRAVALMMAEFARRHVQYGKTWGRVINVSTDSADVFPGEVSYGASKLAMESYSRSAAAELGRYGITVNIVAPGPTQTGWIAPELEAAEASTIPLGRVGQPEDVADVIVLLASHQARWVTGQVIYVGGGNRM